MARLLAPLGLLFVSALLPTGPAYAQQEDTTATDPTVVDTARPSPTDTAATDSRQVPDAPDTLPADSMAADSTLGNTTRSAEARRERARAQAQKVAEAWLSLIDDGAFGTSWDEAAVSLQNAVSREEWQERGAEARAALDSLTSRELTRTEYRDSTAQIPGGTPVVALQYRTAFAAQTVLEAVITTKADTSWKVAGYRMVQSPADSVSAPSDSTKASADSMQNPSPPEARRKPDDPADQPEPDSTQGR